MALPFAFVVFVSFGVIIMALEVYCPFCNSGTITRLSTRMTPVATKAQVQCRSCLALVDVVLQVKAVWKCREEKDAEPTHNKQTNTRRYWPAVAFILLISLIGLGAATWL
ncbi:hypothetical protein R6242_09555 [Iodobacter sp. CM08]|uniref:hypothetical protein n=1 Tax=Iodobacter sp. CM08 TaxID=3085902 RepID=UPI002980BB8D|nr:hypothetical protein [Iodobacter sp. CM08]MDW5416809.1 hypothetical protein [Iodobacter sp. CM08]